MTSSDEAAVVSHRRAQPLHLRMIRRRRQESMAPDLSFNACGAASWAEG
jgi:hypothetical protein